MERNKTLLHEILRVNYSVLPEEGEDSFALRSDEQGAFLCVTDGCGGLGSKRYAALENRTGAYIAARLAARTFAQWAEERRPVPSAHEEAELLCREAEREIFDRLKGFADVHCSEAASRIVGSMQRRLPTTLCALTAQGNALCFWWAGDSRGYVLDADGLHQCTRDHLRGEADAFESLYRDQPLANLLCADRLGRLQASRFQPEKPCIAMVATDGVYGSLPTPMEVEMLLLDTLRLSRSLADWEKKLTKQLAKLAQDDATLLLLPVGFADFEQLKAALLPRRDALQKQFITPVRRRRGNLPFAREKWALYRPEYDWTEGRHE